MEPKPESEVLFPTRNEPEVRSNGGSLEDDLADLETHHTLNDVRRFLEAGPAESAVLAGRPGAYEHLPGELLVAFFALNPSHTLRLQPARFESHPPASANSPALAPLEAPPLASGA